jgi:hypothetical protein
MIVMDHLAEPKFQVTAIFEEIGEKIKMTFRTDFRIRRGLRTSQTLRHLRRESDLRKRPTSCDDGQLAAQAGIGGKVASTGVTNSNDPGVKMSTNSTASPFNGGCTCTCSGVRYCLLTVPLFVSCCHCRWCQQRDRQRFAVKCAD